MKKRMKHLLLVMAMTALAATLPGAAGSPGSFSAFVNGNGSITAPDAYRTTWAHLGTYVLTAQLPNSPPGGHGVGFHEVFTQPESLAAYKKTGQWPDGTVLVNEVRQLKWDELPTGHVMYADKLSGQFVMIRDSKGRFKGNGNWGDGWGWAHFDAADRSRNVSSDYRQDCMSCHDVAKKTNYVFLSGYPDLQ